MINEVKKKAEQSELVINGMKKRMTDLQKNIKDSQAKVA